MARERLHKAIAVLTHPVFITFFVILFLMKSHVVILSRMQDGQTLWFLLIIFLSMVVIPILALGILLRKFTVNEWQSADQNERRAAALAMGLIYLALYFSYREYLPDPIIGIYMIAATISSLVAAIVQKWIRLSFHAAGMAGALAMVLFMAKESLTAAHPAVTVTIVLLLCGIVGWSRLESKAHRPIEIYLGYSLGLLTTSGVLYFNYGF